MRINVFGLVSVGKSLFINSLIYLFSLSGKPENQFKPQASVSKRRETMNINEYILFTSKELKMQNLELYISEKEENNKIISSGKLPTLDIQQRYVISNYNISFVDYPGADDIKDKRDLLGALFNNMNNTHMTIFLIDANKPLINKYENELYTKIKKKEQELKESGIYHKVIIVATKYDVEGEDFDEIFQDFSEKKYYKWSSYNVLANCDYEWPERKNYKDFKNNKLDLELFDYIKNFDYIKKQFICRRKYIINTLRAYIGGRIKRLLIFDYMDSYKSDRKIINLIIEAVFKIGGFMFPAYAFIEEEIIKYLELDYKFHKEIWQFILTNFELKYPHKYKNKIIKYEIINFKTRILKTVAELLTVNKSEIYASYIESRMLVNKTAIIKLIKFPTDELQALQIDIKKILDICFINKGDKITLSQLFSS